MKRNGTVSRCIHNSAQERPNFVSAAQRKESRLFGFCNEVESPPCAYSCAPEMAEAEAELSDTICLSMVSVRRVCGHVLIVARDDAWEVNRWPTHLLTLVAAR